MTFNKSAIKAWRRACHKEIDRLSGDQADRFRPAGLVVMTVYAFGTDVQTLVDLSGQPAPFVREILKRLRAQRVLSGQTLRVNWNESGVMGTVSLACDLLVAVGDIHRPIDPVRSAALKGKAGRKRGGTNRPRVTPAPGAVFTPKISAVPNQHYQITEQGRQAHPARLEGQ